jgi:hypothetical protein
MSHKYVHLIDSLLLSLYVYHMTWRFLSFIRKIVRHIERMKSKYRHCFVHYVFKILSSSFDKEKLQLLSKLIL